MVEALILESFVTAVACLCASSYGPNVEPRTNLRDNIVTAMTGWDRDVFQIVVNSSRKFPFFDKSGDCQLPDADDIDARLIESEYGTKKQKRQSNQPESDISKNCNCKEPVTVPFTRDEELFYKAKNDCDELRQSFANIKNDCVATEYENNNFKEQINDLNSKIISLKEQLDLKRQEIQTKDEKVTNMKLQYESELESLRAKNEEQLNNCKTQNNDFNIQIKKMKSMAPPNLRKLKNNCLIATDSGVANLELNIKEDVYCSKDLDAKFGPGWILLAQRFDGSVDFNRSWSDYVNGFGAYGHKNEFFAGLERIYALTQNSSQELLFIFNDIYNTARFARYDDFSISNEKGGYALKSLGNYSGDAGDALTQHLKQKFATFDKDNESECAKKHAGAWWYIQNTCLKSNLFGLYPTKRLKNDTLKSNGMIWSTFHNTDDGSLISMRMFLRPINVRVRIIIA